MPQFRRSVSALSSQWYCTSSRSEYPVLNCWGTRSEFSSSNLDVSTVNYHTLDASYHDTSYQILTIRQNSFTLSLPMPRRVKSSGVEE